MKQNIKQKFKNWFVAGILVILPISLTFYITMFILNFFDNLIIGETFSDSVISKIPGFGILISIIVIIITGFITTNFLGKFFLKIGERILNKIPLISTLYNTIKQVFSTILSSNSKAFRYVALVEYPRKDMWVLAFVTAKCEGEIQNKIKEDLISVFVPTTPNPTSGFLIFLPEKDAIYLDMKPDDAMKLIISAGVIKDSEEKI